MIEKKVVDALNQPGANLVQIAKATGLSRVYLGKLKNGHDVPMIKKTFALVDYLEEQNFFENDSNSEIDNTSAAGTPGALEGSESS